MKKFLVALDQSKTAELVVDQAVSIAGTGVAELLLLQAVTLPVDVPTDIYYRPKDELPALLQDEAQKNLEVLSQRVPKTISRRTIVELGVPWQTICEVAKREKVDMIVMGAHGYRFYERMLGTTSGRVVTHADRPVLVVRPIEQK